MRKILPILLLSGALLLGACGGPATPTSPTSSTGGTSATSSTGGTSATSSTGGTSATSGAVTSATSSTGGTSATSSTGGTSATSSTGGTSATSGAVTSATSSTGGTSATSGAVTSATAISEAATAISEAAGALSAVADDVTIKQGEALILDATQSAGNISDYKWTIEKAPAGAESVVGQVIREGSSGNVSLQPADYEKYFPTAGTYTVRLTVTDTAGKTSNTDFNVDVP